MFVFLQINEPQGWSKVPGDRRTLKKTKAEK